ncbi:hypothetical protein CEXT_697451 [Caerostris extrusa]|uniref:Uncharacterized protein n=1 Tax=Caerostris extrusa TaxID=172846 RepID=A0AAV4Y5E3_CAEEX|nr:hypothetical protein CEXT_697451 [Caerostris extrusa]
MDVGMWNGCGDEINSVLRSVKWALYLLTTLSKLSSFSSWWTCTCTCRSVRRVDRAEETGQEGHNRSGRLVRVCQVSPFRSNPPLHPKAKRITR